MRKLVVLPNDPIYKYYEKGEIKPRYYNPGNYFDEVCFLSLSDTDIAPEKVQTLVGNARLSMYPLGKPSALTFPLFFRKVRQLIRHIAPDVIRAYNPRQCGSLAVYAGRKLHIPTMLSVHLEYDDQRKYDRRLLLRLVKPLEYYSLRHVDMAICVTDYLQRYAGKYGAKHCVTIYNKVYTAQFAVPQKRKKPEHEKCTILSVGRLDKQKYQECLIRAIQKLDVKLLLIGQGELEGYLKNLSKQLDIAHKVTFISSVPNTEIQQYYRGADIFALATHYEGFCIPILEAMAAGLPVVASNTNPLPEILADTGIVVDATPEAFAGAFQRLMRDPQLQIELGTKAQKRAEILDGEIMEQREMEIYQKILEERIGG